MTLSGPKPATFRLVAQCLNQNTNPQEQKPSGILATARAMREHSLHVTPFCWIRHRQTHRALQPCSLALSLPQHSIHLYIVAPRDRENPLTHRPSQLMRCAFFLFCSVVLPFLLLCSYHLQSYCCTAMSVQSFRNAA
jgi:hypothetical protein